MPTILAVIFFGALFLVASGAAGKSKVAPRVFNLAAGKRYRFAVKVTPRVDATAQQAFKATLLGAGFSDVNIGSDAAATFVSYDTPPQPVSLSFTEGQTIQTIGPHVATLENVREL